MKNCFILSFSVVPLHSELAKYWWIINNSVYVANPSLWLWTRCVFLIYLNVDEWWWCKLGLNDMYTTDNAFYLKCFWKPMCLIVIGKGLVGCCLLFWFCWFGVLFPQTKQFNLFPFSILPSVGECNIFLRRYWM